MPSSLSTARAAWRMDQADHEARGVILPFIRGYFPEEWKNNSKLAMDELGEWAANPGMGHNGGPVLGMDAPPLLFTDPSSAIPALLTTLIDPDVFRVLYSPNKAAEALGGEVKRGTWLDDIIFFPVIEATGEVSSYGDYNENGNAGINVGWPSRQNYIFQVIKEYGEREMERGGLAKINWVAEIDRAAALTMAKFLNLTYLFGVAGLANYGLTNDLNLSAVLTPATKTAGGTAWVLNGRPNATANEVYADIEALYYQLIVQTGGLVQQDTAMTLLMSPGASMGLTITNSFNVNVTDLLKKNFPNITIVTVPQYAAQSTIMPQGVAAGEFVQLIAAEVEGQKAAFPAYSEKMRAHPVIRARSSFSQKVSGGSWGTVMRLPAAAAQMVGV